MRSAMRVLVIMTKARFFREISAVVPARASTRSLDKLSAGCNPNRSATNDGCLWPVPYSIPRVVLAFLPRHSGLKFEKV